MIDAVTIVTEHRRYAAESDLRVRQRDAVVMTAEERRWGRRRVTTRAGRELALALPTGTVLAPGEVLHLDAGWYVVVEPALEPVLTVTPRSPDEAVRIAFEVGNRHLAIAVDGERLLVPDEPATQQLLRRLGVTFERARTIFTPIGFGHRHD